MAQQNQWTPSPGTVIDGRYEVRDELGTGGIARVWRAVDRRTGDEVAVKHIYYGSDNYDRAPGKVEELFGNEVSVLRQVRDAGGHEHIIDLREAVTERGTQMVVVEKVDGHELDDDGVTLSESQAREVTAALADAMGFLHANEIIFRDLKPDNAMLRPDGSPVLIDFNTAKSYDTDVNAEPTCPYCGTALGTNDYVCSNCGQRMDDPEDTVIGQRNEVWKPPEAVEERAHFRQGPWSDVYSLGKLFLMLVMGVGSGTTPRPHGKGPSEFGTDCRSHNDEIIARATKENPDERYNNARVLQVVLENKQPDPPRQARLLHRETGDRYAISPGDTVGRRGAEGPAATVQIDDPRGDYVSAVQVAFDVDDRGRWVLHDRSLNGTYVQRGSGWEHVLCENGRRRMQKKGHDPTEGGTVPPETLPVSDGDLIALVDTSYGVTFTFEEVI